MKKSNKKVIAFLIASALVLTSFGTPTAYSSAASKPKLKTKSITVPVKKSKTIKVTQKSGFKISFKTKSKKIATVTSKGKVTGKKTGSTKVTVTYKKGRSKAKKLGVVNVKVTAKVTPTPTPTPTPISTPTAEPTPTVEPTPTGTPTLDPNNLSVANYPTLFSDIPDLDIIRVGQNYYMISTTMNMCPGIPIMKSTDLVNWQIANYVYDTFEDDDVTNLENGKNMYAHGSWAASLKYNPDDGKYYVAFNSNDHGFYIYTTTDIEKGPWIKHSIKTSFHDPGLLFDDGKLYVGTASSPYTLQELYVNDEAGTVERVGTAHKLFVKPDKSWDLWEGSHLYKVDDYYYVMIIADPYGSQWFRTEVCYRSKDLFSTEWEEKIVYKGGSGGWGAGLAQGGIVDTIYGHWYGFLFQDHNAIGRIPSIVAVEWQDGWPMMGTYDANGNFQANVSESPLTIQLNDSGLDNYFVGDDDFTYKEGEKLKLVWQWNHNPQNDFWSVTANPGYYRITTDKTVKNIWQAHNSLTQRTYGPKCNSETKISVKGMKSGDYAGIAAIGSDYGFVGVMCDDNGDKYIVQASGIFDKANQPITTAKINQTVPTKLAADAQVSLKVEYDFSFTKSGSADKANFYYSTDGSTWTKIGTQLSMKFDTGTTFMGARTWLFNYATKEAGGYVDFDYYKVYN